MPSRSLQSVQLRSQSALICAALLLLLAGGCIGQRNESSAPAPAVNTQAALAEPQGLSPSLPYPAFPLDPGSPLRQPAASAPVSIPGSSFSASGGQQNYKGKGTETSYALVSTAGRCAWAQYETTALGSARPISIEVNVAAASESLQTAPLLPLKYWVALADYRLGRWQWLGPYNETVSLSLDTSVFGQRYYSPAGGLHVAVFTCGGLLSNCAVKLDSIVIQPGGLAESLTRISNAANFTAAQQQPQGSDGDFNFIVIGDMRDGYATYLELLQQAQAYDPAFIVNTGDIVPHGNAIEFEQYAALLDSYDVPILSVPGNHDVSVGRVNYPLYFGAWEWRFDYDGIRIVGLDNANGKFSDADLGYAKDAFACSTSCFAAFHKPPLIERWKVHGMQPDDQGSNMTPMLDLIRETGVDAVFLGHIHIYDEMEISGIPWIISGGGGSPLAEQYGFGLPEFGFTVVHVHDGAFTYEWVKKKG